MRLCQRSIPHIDSALDLPSQEQDMNEENATVLNVKYRKSPLCSQHQYGRIDVQKKQLN